MIVITSHEVAGYRITKTLGLVRGNAIRARNVGRDILAVLRTLVGGEIREYVKLMAEAREQALDRMVEEAEELDADAIVGVRFSTTEILSGAAEMMVYGTAVLLEPKLGSGSSESGETFE
ncbi:MAG: YbjQ family protein [Acidobacteriota bacterium]